MFNFFLFCFSARPTLAAVGPRRSPGTRPARTTCRPRAATITITAVEEAAAGVVVAAEDRQRAARPSTYCTRTSLPWRRVDGTWPSRWWTSRPRRTTWVVFGFRPSASPSPTPPLKPPPCSSSHFKTNPLHPILPVDASCRDRRCQRRVVRVSSREVRSPSPSRGGGGDYRFPGKIWKSNSI